MMYSAIANRRRQERLPQDSGEWSPQPIKFRKLTAPRAPSVSCTAPLWISSVVTFGVHAALVGVIAAHWSLVAGVVLPVGLVSCAIGVTYLSQFRRVSSDEGARLGAIWMMLITPLLMVISAETFLFGMFAWLPSIAFGAASGAVTAAVLKHEG